MEAERQLYLAVCDDCNIRSSSGRQPSEERVKCKECKQELPLPDFSPATRRLRGAQGWICWACQHPVCDGAACEVRQPIARVGKYTCPACLYPPCHLCKTTPRPQSTKYTSRNMPAWTCRSCAGICEKCGERLWGDFKKSKRDTSLCQKCLYPPCACGAPRPCKNSRYYVHEVPAWTCPSCKQP